MEDKKKTITIKEALEVLQEWRYYDKAGCIVYCGDEFDELYALEKAFKKYDMSERKFMFILKVAGVLEALGLANVNNPMRDNEAPDTSKIIPFIRIKRHNNYE